MRGLILFIMGLFMFALDAQAKSPYQSTQEIRTEAEAGFGEILDLWRDGRYDMLYDRTMAGGKASREQFARKIANASKKPACCWEKMQDVKVTVKNDSTVMIQAKVGMEGTAGTEFTTRSYRLEKEDGVWRISQSDINSLAGEGRKKTSHRKAKY